MDWLIIAPIAGLISIAFAVYLFFYLNKQEKGNEKMQQISTAIQDGATAYLRRQNISLAIFVLAMAIVLGIAFNYHMALAYIFGSVCGIIASYFGMVTATRANVRISNAARKSLNKAFPLAFCGGAVMGLSIVGLALIGMSILYYIYGPGQLDIILGFSFGASALALFAKVGGGIYTKTADISADLVGKVELGIPEDDPRNPAVIADNVGDNVGDVAGMGSDIIDSYIAGTIAAMMIGSTLGVIYVIIPLLVNAAGMFASLIGIFFVRIRKMDDPGAALNRGIFSTSLIYIFLTFLIINLLGIGDRGLGIFFATVSGVIAGVIIGLTTDYFTSINRPPVLKMAQSAKSGAAINILSGFSYGIISIVPPIVGIVAATLASWNIAVIYGLDPFYGIATAAAGMLSTAAMVISVDAYGPIVDNAKGIAEQSGLEESVIKVIDKLDAAGNTTKAVSKGFAIGAAALQVLALFGAYIVLVGIEKVDLIDPKVIAGVFIGTMMPPLFSALLILSVGRNASTMIDEVRRQFKEIPGLMEGKAEPDYVTVVDMATKGALKELMFPCVLAIVAPLVVGFVLGTEALAGFLAGSILTGLIFALLMANSGGAWDNAKKYIEAGAFGGKGSEAHKAAVVGDTVGDPFKDTAGPSLNTMITVMALVASVFAPLIAMYALSW
jgi:K(+)-stimulated pyrophosphate-energized sodium pump